MLNYVLFLIEPTTNLPDKSQFFVTCSGWDMQPYQCNSVIAKDILEAEIMVLKSILANEQKIASDCLFYVNHIT